MLESFQIILLSLLPVFWILSGLCRSLVHTLLHHYPDFRKKFNIKNDRYWNPAISWKGKYITDENFELILGPDGKPQNKSGVLIPFYDAFHNFNSWELIFDCLREGIYLSILASIMFNLDLLPTLLILFGGLIVSGAIKILVAFNLGYDSIWR